MARRYRGAIKATPRRRGSTRVRYCATTALKDFKSVEVLLLRLYASDLTEVRQGNVTLWFDWVTYIYTVEQYIIKT